MYSDVGPADDAAEAVDRYLRRAVPFGFSGAVLLAEGGDVRLARGYGHADPDGGQPNRSSTVFSLGSITKPLTATAVLALLDRGRLALEDHLVDRLPGVPDTHAGVTVEQLLSHTAGLPDATGDDFEPGTRNEVLEAIFATPLRFPPGAPTHIRIVGTPFSRRSWRTSPASRSRLDCARSSSIRPAWGPRGIDSRRGNGPISLISLSVTRMSACTWTRSFRAGISSATGSCSPPSTTCTG